MVGKVYKKIQGRIKLNRKLFRVGIVQNSVFYHLTEYILRIFYGTQ